MIGKSLAHYQITGLLGKGGMGEVYRARDTKLDREVALKSLPAELAKDPARLERFQREAKAVARLSHPNVVVLHSVEEAEDEHFLTMELVDGNSLAQTIPPGGMELSQLLSLVIPIADAIAYAHGKGITHRDLKPANIMIDAEGRPKILDFGLAKLLAPIAEGLGDETLRVDEPITKEGHVLGTTSYMSPEQLEGKEVDPRSDVFSLGILLYEMATGRRPFSGDSTVAIMTSILRDDPPSLSAVRENLPRQIGRIVARCLQKQPQDRYQTARGVRNDLQELQHEVDVEKTSSGSRPIAVAPRRKLPMMPLLGFATLVLIAAAVVFWLPRGGPDESSTGESDVVTESDQRQMIVVLPFENLGAPDDEYFADGLTEEITSRMAALPGLGVISRRSAMQYKDNRPGLREIGEQLGVDFVLEGTVRWEHRADGSNRIRVTPQLIRVSDDTHLWSDRYDRELAEIFSVQGEIASEVARELDITLLASQRDALEARPTENMDAYQAYLRAMELWNRPGGSDPERFRLAIELFERAVELDPNFVEAWAELASANDMLYVMGAEGEEILATAEEAIQAAEAVFPDHFKVRMARGYHYYLGYFEYERALAEFAKVEAERPDDPSVHEAIGYIRRRQGRIRDSVTRLEKAARLDPQNAHIALMLAGTYAGMREHATADRLFDRAIALEPDSPVAYQEKAQNLIAWRGAVEEARAVIDAIPGTRDAALVLQQAYLDLFSREFAEGARRLEGITPDDLPSPFDKAYLFMIRGEGLSRSGQPETARAEFEQGLTFVQNWMGGKNPANPLRSMAAVFHARIGQEGEARRMLETSDDIRPKDLFYAIGDNYGRAMTATILGDQDTAIDILQKLLDSQYFQPVTVQTLRLNPMWDPLRDNPRFDHLLVERSSDAISG